VDVQGTERETLKMKIHVESKQLGNHAMDRYFKSKFDYLVLNDEEI
jgi:hypothetical protein